MEKEKSLRRCVCLSLAVVVAAAFPADAQTDSTTAVEGARTALASPMVSGFERFARHAEIPEQLAGSLLISELSCVACHASSDTGLQPKNGPHLVGAGNRLQPDWLRRYLIDPMKVKVGTTMPHGLAWLPAAERSDAIDALAAFLGTQLQPFTTIKGDGATPVVHEFWRRGDSNRGIKLYHSIGCVACHQPDAHYETAEPKPSAIDVLIDQLDPEELAELGLAGASRRVASVPLGELANKYSQRSLTMMLLDPAETRPSARMPSLRLTPAQAADVAAYLLGEKAPSVHDIVPSESPQELVAQGRSLFVQYRCSNCHTATGVNERLPARQLAELDAAAPSSCIKNPSDVMPHYRLDDLQQKAIRAVLNSGQTPNRTAAEEVSFGMLQLNCYACHDRDGLGGMGRYRKAYFETFGNVDIGDEGRLPPTLVGVGGKLLPEALATVFRPSTPPHRSYMTVRMPSYHAASVESIVASLPEADGVDKSTEHEVFSERQALAEAGRDLLNTGCVECHAFGGESLPGVVGIDLSGITARVYPKWFHDFVLNPGALKQRTRMPTFFPDGVSNRQDLLDGDVHRQLSAAWAYLKNLEKEPLPEKIAIARAANYELVPTNKPIVLRTFMDDAGTHAIAVGFPQGAHYAFDAEHVRLATAWRGQFLDARGTWFERFTPPAEPLGSQHVQLPAGPLFQLDKPGDVQFGGYRLDSAGVPTLLYRYAGWSIEDRIDAMGNGGLKRTLNVHAPAAQENIVLRAHAAKQLQPSGPSAYSDDQGLTVVLPERLARAGALRQSEGLQEWLIPLSVPEKMTFVLEYRW